ncbi:prephenate dehydratase [Laceyella sacchari]|uniref:prephenate dehydratase n=1 Tax=Laceyella sacchari TaxID=37482 RepID=UPI001049075B|nr:prephenate dehydratase [Laceyella sacchari]TCW41098.1 prephenate dehydratase [Laceyella sacchari]
MNNKVAYLGPIGTFTHAAASSLFEGHSVQLEPYPTIVDTLQAVAEKKADVAVVPIENALEGSVHMTLDHLVHHVDLPIWRELIYPISHCLLAHPNQAATKLSEFTHVLSHPQAIAQCYHTVRKLIPGVTFVHTDSTALAAAKVGERADEKWLAIGTTQAAECHQLQVRQAEVQDQPNNFTRFWAVGRPAFAVEDVDGKHKTCLQVTLPADYPGALYQVLAAFSWRKINLCRIESRPTKTGLGNYFFLIEAELPIRHVLLQGAIEEVTALGCKVRVLGSFPYHYYRERQTALRN